MGKDNHANNNYFGFINCFSIDTIFGSICAPDEMSCSFNNSKKLLIQQVFALPNKRKQKAHVE